jgi:transglutaminase-like putative cysteine protease
MNHAPDRLWDLPSAAILLLVLLSTSEGLFTTQWAPGLVTAILLAEAGAVLGMALGFSQFKRAAVFWFSFGYSLPIVILVLGWILNGGNSWMERIADLSARLTYSLALFFISRPVQDTALFVVFMALVFWIIGLMAGFALTRFGNFIGAVVPAGVVLMTVQVYNAGRGGGNIILAAYFLLSVLELGRMTYAKRRVYWKKQGVALLVESRTDLNLTLVIAACVIVALVWLAPTSAKQFSDIKTAWDKLSHPLRNVQENLGHAVAGLQAPGTVRPVDFYDDNLSLGNQAATGETELFRIRAPLENGLPRYYWRVRSYNTFLNDQWYSQDATVTNFVPTQASFPLAVPELLTGEFSFTSLVLNLAVLVTPAGPVWVSHASEVVFLQTPDGKMDPVQFLSQPSILSGQQYLVHANLSEPTIQQMGNAGDVYPDWITKNYLQLPKTLSPEIVALAHRITEQARTPYDKADAITQYLRSNITYSTTVNTPPPGQNSLDWFLFDSKTGFCNYYATAEVILLRSVGIPARLVVGFAQGEFTSPNLYVVRERDEHAWPEVYFPGVGWVEFEPTSNQAPLVRPLGENLPSAGQLGNGTPVFPPVQNIPAHPTPIAAEGTGTSSGPGRVVTWLLALILICAILFTILRVNSFGLFDGFPEGDEEVARNSLPAVVKRLVENQGLASPNWLSRWAYLAGLSPIERSFTTVYTSLRWLGGKATTAQTPAEAAAALAEQLPKVSIEIDSLLHEYQRQLYSLRHGRVHPARSAARTIQQEALRVAIQQRWRRFRSIFKLGQR